MGEPELLGQTVVVIGGSAGIGLETARRARAAWADVILTGRDPDRLRRAASELDARSIAAFDATDPAALEAFFQKLPNPIDHVMVTAGRPYYGRLLEMDVAQARRALDDHLWMVIQVARNAAEKVRPGGTCGAPSIDRAPRGRAARETAWTSTSSSSEAARRAFHCPRGWRVVGRRCSSPNARSSAAPARTRAATPTKALLASARAAHVARSGARLSIRAESVQVDFPAVIARKDAMVRTWQEGVASRIAAAGPSLRLIRGQARFVGDRTIELAGERHRAPVVVLNVGTRPIEPPIRGLSGVPWLDNRRAMQLSAVPTHLVVVGGGYVGCEFAQLTPLRGRALRCPSSGGQESRGSDCTCPRRRRRVAAAGAVTAACRRTGRRRRSCHRGRR